MKFFISTFLIFYSFQSFGWGLTGHRVVGEIAQRHIKKKTARRLKKIMGNETLVIASNWPDEMRSNPDWSHASTWHYVSIPEHGDYSQKEAPDEDIVMAIREQTAILKNNLSNAKQKRIAIRWITHLIGDIHQPLHVGRKDDRGGNDIKLKWFSSESNLHKVWDSEMIDSEKLSYKDYVDMIDRLDKNQQKIMSYGYNNIDLWIHEGVSLRDQVYNYDDSNGYWMYTYKFQNKKTMNERLLKAGHRLAKWLDEALD